MAIIFVRPGDSDFGEAYRNCKPVITFDVFDSKTSRTVTIEGNFVDEVCLASSVQGKSVVVAIKKSDFEYYFKRNLAQLTWEKSYSMTPTRGPVDSPNKKSIKIDSNSPEFAKLLATMKLPSDWVKAKNISQCSNGIEPYADTVYVRNADISSGTITSDKLTVGYGATEQWYISPTEIDTAFSREYYLTEEKKEMSNVIDNKLYLVIGEGPHKGKYVTKIAINKANEFVVEAKGENAYFSVKETDLERVLPYSVDVRFMAPNGAALNGRVYSYWSNPGDVANGDVIFSTEYGNPMIVVAIDTKAESATKFLTGSVMKPTKVLEGK